MIEKPEREDLLEIVKMVSGALEHFDSICADDVAGNPLRSELLTLAIQDRQLAADRVCELCTDYILENWKQ